MKSKKYQPRFYREWPHSEDLVSFRVAIAESDLFIRARKDLSAEAHASLADLRAQLEGYISRHPDFQTSLVPVDIEPFAPRVIREMSEAAAAAGVGPMAAVAGAVAERIGAELMAASPDIIVENGGDIFISTAKERRVSIYAGPHLPPLHVLLPPRRSPCGICTSSGTLGHSLSFGKADSVTIFAGTTALADAVATAAGNSIQSDRDVEKAMDLALRIEGVWGIAAVIGRTLGLRGDIQLVE